jgi:two-component system response regulator FlrC
MTNAKILVVEDDSHMRLALQATLKKAGYQVDTAEDVHQAKERLRLSTYGLVLTDLRMPGGSGMEVLRQVKAHGLHTPVIVLTAYGTVEGAVEAMKEGALDFIQKPFSLEEIQEAVHRALSANGSFKQEKISLEGMQDVEILTKDPAMLEVMETARAVASSKAPVLIQGESGTGKELLARFIHLHSPRRSRPLVAINCAAIPEHLLESELFGHEKGAFTGAISRKIGKFEQAHGGTLLLDEIGEMNLTLQAKLLRVLQDWQIDRIGGKEPISVDVRVVATTNADLARCVQEGKFRQDLYFRLNVIPLVLPPLRQRKEDIELLARHFLQCFCGTYGKKIDGFTKDAMEKLLGHQWKGNVRELKNTVERAVLLAKGNKLDVHDIQLDGWQVPGDQKVFLEGSVKEVERELILSTLEREGWNRTRASRRLGISIRTLRNKLQEYRREGLLPSHVHREAGNVG